MTDEEKLAQEQAEQAKLQLEEKAFKEGITMEELQEREGGDKLPNPPNPPNPNDTPPDEGEYESPQILNSFLESKKESDPEFDLPEHFKTGKHEDGSDVTDSDVIKFIREDTLNISSYSDNPKADAYIKLMIEQSKAKGEEFNLEDFVKESNKDLFTGNLSREEKLFNAIKLEVGKRDENDADGLSDEEIKEDIEKMSNIEKTRRIRSIDEDKLKAINHKAAKTIEKTNTLIETEFSKQQVKDKELLDNFELIAKSTKNVSGIQFSDDEHKKFLEELPTFAKTSLTKDEKGRLYPVSELDKVFMDIMGSPEKRVQLIPWIWKIKNGGLSEYTTLLKEGEKAKIEKKFTSSPEEQSNYGSSDNDENAFKEG